MLYTHPHPTATSLSLVINNFSTFDRYNDKIALLDVNASFTNQFNYHFFLEKRFIFKVVFDI